MRFYKALGVLLLLPSLVVAGDVALDEVLKKSKDILNRSESIAGDDVDALREKGSEPDMDSQWLKPEQDGLANAKVDENDSAQQRGWNSIIQSVEQSSMLQDQGPPHPDVPADVIYVYISLSMPDETIRNLFLQALADDALSDTIFVLRGWKPPRIGDLVAKLNELFPDAEKLRQLPNVQINPNLFDQQAIDRVPTYSTKDASGQWRTIMGTTSISDAVARIRAGRYLDEAIGPTYEIEEPNILDFIKGKLANIDWSQEVERVKADVLTKTTSGRTLPYAEQDSSYLVDLTIINNRDLSGPAGEVFAYAGTSVNPFDHMTVRRRYVFIDANSEAQVEQARAWRKEHELITVITTVPLRSVDQRRRVIGLLGQPVHEINEQLIQRFRLKAVPSIAYQEDRMLRVDVVGVREDRTLTSLGGPTYE